ncbi:MAG: aldehyde dehydrogenase family protein, partial [Actinomycetota bacterium]|nr:aldehyde dehydrogenase family protein [Actinomycetota bacterium]
MPAFEYAPAPESRSVVDIRSSYGLFIGGEFVDGLGDAAFKTVSPATEEVLADITQAGPADVDRAVAAAKRAFEEGPWARMLPRERARVMHRIADIVESRDQQLAEMESFDSGLP